MKDLNVDGVQYRTDRLNAFEQLHIFRKLTPVISGLVETMAAARGMESAGFVAEEAAANPHFWSAIGPVARAISEMSTENTEYVIKTCLQKVTRRNEMGQWGPLMTQSGHLLFEELELGAMLQLTYAVLEDNLGNFFQSGLVNGSGLAPANMPSSG